MKAVVYYQYYDIIIIMIESDQARQSKRSEANAQPKAQSHGERVCRKQY